MTWILKLEEVRDWKVIRRQKVMTVERPSSIKTVDDIGLRSDDAMLNGDFEKRNTTDQYIKPDTTTLALAACPPRI